MNTIKELEKRINEIERKLEYITSIDFITERKVNKLFKETNNFLYKKAQAHTWISPDEDKFIKVHKLLRLIMDYLKIKVENRGEVIVKK